MKTDMIINDVVNIFNTIVNDGFRERHEILIHENSITVANFHKSLGIASDKDYRTRYTTLCNCLTDYIVKSNSTCTEIFYNVSRKIKLTNNCTDNDFVLINYAYDYIDKIKSTRDKITRDIYLSNKSSSEYRAMYIDLLNNMVDDFN